jgi:hypothetical protein
VFIYQRCPSQEAWDVEEFLLFFFFVERDCSLSRWKEPATGSYAVPIEYSVHQCSKWAGIPYRNLFLSMNFIPALVNINYPFIVLRLFLLCYVCCIKQIGPRVFKYWTTVVYVMQLVWNVCARIPASRLARANLHPVHAAQLTRNLW